jgi:predicted RNA binding protein YcfA (HicA-like mRNA interferase family)
MVKLPVFKPGEVVAVLQKLGFKEIRQKGSHKQFKHSDGRFTTVPFHKGKDISPLLLKQIIKDIKISEEEFLENK